MEWTAEYIVYVVCVLFCGTAASSVQVDKYSYVVWNRQTVEIYTTSNSKEIPGYNVAQATYENKINETGWAFLEIHTSQAYSDRQQAFAAGYIEGFLTQNLVWMHWQNILKGYCINKTDVCAKIEQFVDENEAYITRMVKKFPKDPYWYQVKLYYIQIEGLAVGYNDATNDKSQSLSVRDIIWINMLGDLDELAVAVSGTEPTTDGRLFGGDHCSGLVKLLADHSDLYTSQVTWNSYQSMLRIQKMYVMPLKVSPDSEQLIPGHKMSFSSYPAFVQSTDDLYVISSGLVAAETTIGNSNLSLFRLVKPHGQILEYARCMLANRLATSGEEWVKIFKKYNSGTYNNQWYIVDYKRFRPRRAGQEARVKPGLLWVAEQLPGYVHAADMTTHLLESEYWPSYNLPYFPDVFNMSGGQVRVDMFGEWFSYNGNPRAQMFLEKQGGVNNMEDMYRLMRYNDYQHDPLARCDACVPPYSACNAISARNDLNPANGTYPFRALGHRSHGATDVKITNSDLAQSYQFLSVSSPTYNISRGIPPFQWSKTDFDTISRVGHPDLWMFKPLTHKWEWEQVSTKIMSTD